MATYTYDEILEKHIGKMSLFQFFLCTLASLDAVVYSFYTLSPVFTANIPPHQCAITDIPVGSNCSLEQYQSLFNPIVCKDGTCEVDGCYQYSINGTELYDILANGYCPSVNNTFSPNWNGNGTLEKKKCGSWTYGESFYSDTAVREWDLICDAEGLGRTISGAYMFGRLIGCLFFTPLADIIGRRWVMLGTTVASCISAFSGGFSTNVYLFITSRFALGLFDMVRSNTGFILGVEYIHRSKRSFFSGLWSMFWVLGYITLPGIAYLLREWRHLQMFSALPDVPLFFLFYFCLPESPRWLLTKNRKEEMKAFITKLAKYNKRTLPDEWDIAAEGKQEKLASIMELLRAPRMRLATLLCAYIFFSCSFLYYGLSMNSSQLAGNPYLNFFLSGLVEGPAYIYVLALYEKSPRRPSFASFMGIGGLLLLLTIPIPKHLGWLVVTFTMIGKFAITIAFQITWLIVTEVFPTSVRGLALGITNSVARFGSFVSTYVLMLSTIYKGLPTIIFGVVPLIATGLILLLPETRGITLLQSLDEGEKFLEENMCHPSGCRRGREENAKYDPTEKTSEII